MAQLYVLDMAERQMLVLAIVELNQMRELNVLTGSQILTNSFFSYYKSGCKISLG